ncbi:thiamine phosphate synthase [Bacillus sp. OxB-1]|uniref:thiamine phosphate synthase n=1 Tax=Bacillus sp. (strain OxB-1) TaxID=98228 RepID=UPI0005979DBB|nr:thiamine phosphate synthase [Bacillus sp. OxB-1]
MSSLSIKKQLKLYFIMGSNNTGAVEPLNVLEAALQGGVTCFQLREKGDGALIGEAKREFAQQCQQLCQRYSVPFIINDDVELAMAVDADGVHVGQDDMDAGRVRERLGSNKILGVSTHTLEEVQQALADGADYVGMGPVYATMSKADAKPVAGTGLIRKTASLHPDLPIVGIGGITLDNFEPVIQAGASGVSLISAIASADDPFATAQKFAATIEEIIQREGASS